MALVAHIYHIPPRVLPAIQAVEGGAPGMVSHNPNGTDDYGVMQINTVWMPALQRVTGLPVAVLRDRLINAACFNIAAAGAVMQLQLFEVHGDVMRAVGNYHSHTAALHDQYKLKVLAQASRIFSTR
jgi:hypothetical protein